MTLKEFKAKHGDVLISELAWCDLDKLARGAALFYVSLTNRKGPKEDRNIVCSDFALTMGIGNTPRTLTVARTTHAGYLALSEITEPDLRDDGRIALFRTRPLPADDPRSTKLCGEWE